MGAGMSGQLALLPVSSGGATSGASGSAGTAAENKRTALLDDLAVASGVAPWVGARIGLDGSNEAGLTYAGRAVRLDGRHAFELGTPTLSVGLGGTVLMPRRPNSASEAEGGGVYGGGLDVPVLLGVTSTADLYSLWIGPRGGFEIIRGNIASASSQSTTDATSGAVDAMHYHVGFVVGVRAGFRHVHVALELDGAYHVAEGELGTMSTEIEQFTLTPAGALILSF